MNLLSHVFFAIAISEVLGLELIAVILGAIIPDIDYMIGVTHRTIMHSLLFVTILFYFSYKKNKKWGISLSIGLLSHLLLDVLTVQGVMLLWPINIFFGYGIFYSLDNSINLLFLVFFIILIWNKDLIKNKLEGIHYKKLQLIVFSILIIPIILTIPYNLFQTSSCVNTNLSNIYSNIESFSETCVSINGFVCSNVWDYTSSSDNTYEIFELCNSNESINVWLIDSISPGLELNDSITIKGIFTTKYYETSGYEIYKIKSVSKN